MFTSIGVRLLLSSGTDGIDTDAGWWLIQQFVTIDKVHRESGTKPPLRMGKYQKLLPLKDKNGKWDENDWMDTMTDIAAEFELIWNLGTLDQNNYD